MNHALIVDDDVDAAQTLAALVADKDFTVSTAATLRDARRQIALQAPEIVLLDMQLPDGNGMDLFADTQLVANSDIVLVTGYASLESSIRALRLGAADYLVKPIVVEQLQGILSRVMRPAAPQPERDRMLAELETSGRFGPLWGRSAVMRRLYEQLDRVATTLVSVFISGESGTGKELVARTVHDLSRRDQKPFLAVNCGAVSANLMESEIFGHEKGSFTGAERQHRGFFERADGGTLFLDEITEMPGELQVKLLRVVETGRFTRVGSTQELQTDVRIIAATNRQPSQAVADGKLREDLYYRLSVFPIEVPPLRERIEDIPLLADHFLRSIGLGEGHMKRLSPAALAQLAHHPWRGNVRELRNVMHRAYVMTPGSIIDDNWMTCAASSAPPRPGEPACASLVLPIGASMADAQRQLILATLRHCNFQRERTAAVLGISLKTLYNRLRELQLFTGAEAATPGPAKALPKV